MAELIDSLRTLKDWLLADAGALAGFLSLLLALFVLLETVKLRRIEIDPEITVYLDSTPGTPGIYDLVVKNVGRGQASQLRFNVDPDPDIDNGWRLTSMAMISEGLSHMPPGQEIRLLIGDYAQLNKGPITISIAYLGPKTWLRRPSKFSSEYTIDVRQFAQRFDLGKKPNEELMDELRKITAAVHQVAINVRRPSQRTLDKKREGQTEMADQSEERQEPRFCEGKTVSEMLAPANPRYVVVGPQPWMEAYCSLDAGELQHRVAAVSAHAEGFGLWLGTLALYRTAFSRPYDLSQEPTREHNASAVFRLDLLGLAGGNIKPTMDAALTGYYSSCMALERHMLETWRRVAYARLHPSDIWRWIPQDRWPEDVQPVSDQLPAEKGGMPINVPKADRIANVITQFGGTQEKAFLECVQRGFDYLSSHSHPTLEGATQTWNPDEEGRRFFGPTYSELHAIRCLRWGLLAGGMLLYEVAHLADQGEAWISEFNEILANGKRWGKANSGGRFTEEASQDASEE